MTGGELHDLPMNVWFKMEGNSSFSDRVMRVPGGWIFVIRDEKGKETNPVFVPATSEAILEQLTQINIELTRLNLTVEEM